MSRPDSNQSNGPISDPPGTWASLVNISRSLKKLDLHVPSRIPICKPEFHIGRAEHSDLVISHLGISGRHCVISKNTTGDHAFNIIDYSTNGTYVNGQRIQKGVMQDVDFGARLELMRIGESRLTFLVGKSTEVELLNNKYVIRTHLGMGAYAKVKLGFDPVTQTQYALKIIDRKMLGTHSQDTTSILQEVRILHTLNHYGVVRVHDHFSNASRIYIVLDYVPGGDLLEALIKRSDPLDLESAKDIFVQLTEAVEYLHKNHVVHRDIKPENILIDDREAHESLAMLNEESKKSATQSQTQTQNVFNVNGVNLTSRNFDQTNNEKYRINDVLRKEYAQQPKLGASGVRVKITDFGLSKSVVEEEDDSESDMDAESFQQKRVASNALNTYRGNDSEAARRSRKQKRKELSTVCGTPQYLAPEVLKLFKPKPGQSKETYGPEVDIWSLGAILFVMLTLHTPFQEAQLQKEALVGKYERHRVAHCPPEVVNLLDGLFNPDPAQRLTIPQIKNHPWCKGLFEERAAELRAKQVSLGKAQVPMPSMAVSLHDEIGEEDYQQKKRKTIPVDDTTAMNFDDDIGEEEEDQNKEVKRSRPNKE